MSETRTRTPARPKAEPALGPARFDGVRLERGRFALECARAGEVGGRILAFVDGIPIGSSGEVASAEAGAEVTIACDRFPAVGMPCQVRFASGAGETDIAPPYVLRTAAEAERLVGPGRVEDVRVAIRNGVIAGRGVNRVNALSRPVLLGRVNGELLREVRMAAPRPREEGGSALDFTLAIDPADLTESGAHYEILSLPDMTVLAGLSFPRSDASALSAAVARNAAAIENLSRRLHLETARAAEAAQQRHAEQGRAMEAVAEYLIALVYDRFADRGADAGRERDETLASFREAVARAARGEGALDLHDYASAPPSSAYFADGWSWLEQDSKGFDFRWMGLGAAVFNPQPHRPVTQVTVSIATTYRGIPPEITAVLDADGADVELVAAPNGAPYTLKILPRAGGKPRLVQVLRLVSARAGRPSEDEGTEDERVLSVGVTGVVFYYGD
ncbi:MAG: hypothetical protein ACK4U0_11770 [Mesorhizobium sp.]